jgi:hypothetical protein
MNNILRGRRSGCLWLFILLGVFGLGALAYGLRLLPPLPFPFVATPTTTAATDVEPVIRGYHDAELAALQTLSQDVLNQLPVFAHGAALENLAQEVAALQNAGQFQKMQIEEMVITQVVETADQIEVLTEEVQTLATYLQQDGSLLQHERYRRSVVYHLVLDADRWKVDRVIVTSQRAL